MILIRFLLLCHWLDEYNYSYLFPKFGRLRKLISIHQSIYKRDHNAFYMHEVICATKPVFTWPFKQNHLTFLLHGFHKHMPSLIHISFFVTVAYQSIAPLYMLNMSLLVCGSDFKLLNFLWFTSFLNACCVKCILLYFGLLILFTIKYLSSIERVCMFY